MEVTRKRATLQAGGITAVIGGLGAIFVNAVHPHPPSQTDELLRLVGSVPYWTVLHYAAAFTAAMMVSGLALSAVVGHLSEAGTVANKSGSASISQPTMYAS